MSVWRNASETPPDQPVIVMDEVGRVAVGIPTYYPFTIEKRPGDEHKLWGFRGTVVYCDNHWDGGWMIDCTATISSLFGEVKKWRLIPPERLAIHVNDEGKGR